MNDELAGRVVSAMEQMVGAFDQVRANLPAMAGLGMAVANMRTHVHEARMLLAPPEEPAVQREEPPKIEDTHGELTAAHEAAVAVSMPVQGPVITRPSPEVAPPPAEPTPEPALPMPPAEAVEPAPPEIPAAEAPAAAEPQPDHTGAASGASPA